MTEREQDTVLVRPSDSGRDSLGERAVRGSLWTIGGYGASQLLRLVSNLVLTRLLFPEAFGLMALVNALLTGLGMFSDLGLAPSIIQSRRGNEPRFLATAWTLQILRGGVLWLAAFLLAGPMAGFYEQAELQGIWSFAALTVVISGFNSTSLPRLQRQVDIRKLVSLEFLAQASALAVMIVWALQAPTVWVLVGGAMVASTVKMAGSHWLEPGRRDRFGWDRDAARELFGFGKWIFVSTVLAFCVGQADRLIFGKLVTLSELGVYSIAVTLSSLPVLLSRRIGNSVIFPTFSRAVRSGAPFEPVYRRTRDSILALGGLPVAILLASGVPLVELLYDDRYAAAGPLLQILALGTWFRVLEIPSGSALLAWGAPRQLASASGVMLGGIIAFVPLGWLLLGFQGAIGGYVAAEGLRYVRIALAARRHGAPPISRELIASGLLFAAAAAGMAAGSLLGSDASLLGRLAVSAAVGGGLWGGVALAAVGRDVGGLLGRALGGGTTP